MMEGNVQSPTPVLSAAPVPLLPRPDRLYRRWLPGRQGGSIAPEKVQALLASYGLSPLGDVDHTHSGRGETLILPTSGGKKVLKRYKATVAAEAIRHEHAILAYLEQIAFPAPRLVARANGATWIRDGEDEQYALFDYLEGYFHYHNYYLLPGRTRQFIYDSGRALAALHQALHDLSPDGHNPNGFKSRSGKRWREMEWFLERLAWCRGSGTEERSGVSRRLLARLEPLETQLPELDATLARVGLPLMIIHGDYGPYNLLFKEGEATVILDFELARLDWRLADLANAIPSFAQNRLGFSFRKMNVFLDGYRSLLPLPESEYQHLPTVWRFLALRRAIVCAYRFFKSGQAHWASQAEEKLQLAKWVQHERQAFSSYV